MVRGSGCVSRHIKARISSGEYRAKYMKINGIMDNKTAKNKYHLFSLPSVTPNEM